MHLSARRFKVKAVRTSYDVEKVFNTDIPALQHGNDGLIYTSVNTPYAPGTDPNMCAASFALGQMRLARLLTPPRIAD